MKYLQCLRPVQRGPAATDRPDRLADGLAAGLAGHSHVTVFIRLLAVRRYHGDDDGGASASGHRGAGAIYFHMFANNN